MTSQGEGRGRDRRAHRNTPYARRLSLLSRLTGTVSRILPESWVPAWLQADEEQAPAEQTGGPSARRHHLNDGAAGWTPTVSVQQLGGVQLGPDRDGATTLPSPVGWPPPSAATDRPTPPTVWPAAVGGRGVQASSTDRLTSPAVWPAVGARPAAAGGSEPLPEPAGRTPGLDQSLARKRRRRQQQEDADLSEDSDPVTAEAGPEMRPTGRPQPSALSGKRPRFNVAALSTSLMSQEEVASSSSGGGGATMSPCYPGPTRYGGAANHRRLRVPPPTSVGPYLVRPRAVPVRAPAAGQDEPVTMSTTARRILSVLEHMSTPVTDARRVPLASPGARLLEASFSGDSSRRAGLYGAYGARLGHRPRSPPVHRVVSPVKVTVEPNRSLRAARADTDAQDAACRRVTFSSETSEATITATTAAGGASAPGGKIRRQKERSHYSASRPEPAPPQSEPLPDVSLPFSAALRPFSLSTSTPKPAADVAAATKRAAAASKSFSFASPQPVAVAAGLVNGLPDAVDLSFTFSAPAVVDGCRPAVAAVTVTSPATRSETTATAGDRLLDKFKPALGSWECTMCMLSNRKSASVCAACLTARPAPAGSTPTSAAAKTQHAPLASTWGDTFKPAAGAWTCDTCMVSNKQDVAKCVACGTPSSSSSSIKPSTTDTAATPRDSQVDTAATPMTTSWGDKFKLVAGTWTCETCMLSNKPDAVKCAACGTPSAAAGPAKPVVAEKAVVSTPVVSASWGGKFRSVAGTWTCDTCMVSNKPGAVKCAACETPNANGKAKTPADQMWECSTCLVRNRAAVTRCVACESPRPQARSPQNQPAGGALAGGFSFGFAGGRSASPAAVSTAGSGVDGFAVAAPAASTPAAAAVTFGFGAGVKTTAASSPPTSAVAAGPAFQFGTGSSGGSRKRKQTAAVEKPAPQLKSGSIMDVLGKAFADPAKSAAGGAAKAGKQTAVLPANGVFAIGATPVGKDSPAPAVLAFASPAVTLEGAGVPASSATKRSATPDKTAASSFGTKSPQGGSKVSGGFAFDAKASTGSEKPGVTFSFGAPVSKEADKAQDKTGGFVFGGKAPEEKIGAAGGLSFGAKASEASNKPAPAFVFGATAPDGSAKPAGGFTFGTKSADSIEKPADLFSFGSKASTGTDKPAAPLPFGTTPDKVDKPAAMFSFGSGSIPSTKPATTAAFPSSWSSADNKSTNASTGFSFGAPAAASTTAAGDKSVNAGPVFGATFAFGAASANGPSAKPEAATPAPVPVPTSEAGAPGVFKFGSNPPASVAAAPFGALTAAPDAAVPTASAPAATGAPFAFGAKTPGVFQFGGSQPAPTTTTAAAATAGVFPFGASQPAPATTTTTAAPAAPFAFGGSTPAPGVFAFGSSQPAAGAFGAAAAPPSAGFSFGAGASAAAPRFNFSSGQAAALAPGVFQFGTPSAGAPAPAAATPQFGATAPAQPPNPFSASGGVVAGRRIKPARRRIKK